jgi:hypothetical protein
MHRLVMSVQILKRVQMIQMQINKRTITTSSNRTQQCDIPVGQFYLDIFAQPWTTRFACHPTFVAEGKTDSVSLIHMGSVVARDLKMESPSSPQTNRVLSQLARQLRLERNDVRL